MKLENTKFKSILVQQNQMLLTSFKAESSLTNAAEVAAVTSSYINRSVILCEPIFCRSLNLSFRPDQTVIISANPLDTANSHALATVAEFQVFIAQTIRHLYIVVVSLCNIYDYLNLEPYNQKMGEYYFQDTLKKVLGLQNALAYEIETDQQRSIFARANVDDIADIGLPINYTVDKGLSYLFFLL